MGTRSSKPRRGRAVSSEQQNRIVREEMQHITESISDPIKQRENLNYLSQTYSEIISYFSLQLQFLNGEDSTFQRASLRALVDQLFSINHSNSLARVLQEAQMGHKHFNETDSQRLNIFYHVCFFNKYFENDILACRESEAKTIQMRQDFKRFIQRILASERNFALTNLSIQFEKTLSHLLEDHLSAGRSESAVIARKFSLEEANCLVKVFQIVSQTLIYLAHSVIKHILPSLSQQGDATLFGDESVLEEEIFTGEIIQAWLFRGNNLKIFHSACETQQQHARLLSSVAAFPFSVSPQHLFNNSDYEGGDTSVMEHSFCGRISTKRSSSTHPDVSMSPKAANKEGQQQPLNFQINPKQFIYTSPVATTQKYLFFENAAVVESQVIHEDEKEDEDADKSQQLYLTSKLQVDNHLAEKSPSTQKVIINSFVMNESHQQGTSTFNYVDPADKANRYDQTNNSSFVSTFSTPPQALQSHQTDSILLQKISPPFVGQSQEDRIRRSTIINRRVEGTMVDSIVKSVSSMRRHLQGNYEPYMSRVFDEIDIVMNEQSVFRTIRLVQALIIKVKGFFAESVQVAETREFLNPKEDFLPAMSFALSSYLDYRPQMRYNLFRLIPYIDLIAQDTLLHKGINEVKGLIQNMFNVEPEQSNLTSLIKSNASVINEL